MSAQPADPTVSGRTAESPTGNREGVEVTVDGDRYSIRDGLTATVTNRGRRDVFADDEKSDCTIVMLQRKSGAEWISLRTCGAERAPRVVRIAAGERQTARLNFAGENFRPDPVVPGTYRILFSYRWGATPEGSEPERAQSVIFTID